MNDLLTIDARVKDLLVGLVEAGGMRIAASPPELVAYCSQSVRLAVQEGPEGADERRQAVRQLLRWGGFKPSGRSKPAQEYLWRVAQEPDQWPAIFNAVDLLNVVSLRSGLPISLLAIGRIGIPLLVRYGAAGESFVFNQAGQQLDLTGLLCVCRHEGDHSQPLGTPVKDSQLAKVTSSDAHVLACIFAPRSSVSSGILEKWVSELADGFRQWCQPQFVRTNLVSSTG